MIQKKVKKIVILFFAVLITSGTFIHYFQEKVPENLSVHRRTFKPLIKLARINNLTELKDKLVKKEISINEFDRLFVASLKNSDAKEKEYYKRKKEIIKSNSYFNFPNIRRFTFMLMLILLGFVSSVFGIYANINKDLELKPILNKVGVLLGGVSFFWLFWVFFNSTINENNITYLVLFIIVGFISMYLTFLFVKYATVKGLKIKTLVDFIFRTRNKHYPEIASKGLYAEIHDRALRNGKTIEESSNDFEEDLLGTLEKIVK